MAVPTGNQIHDLRGVQCLKGDAITWFDVPAGFDVESFWFQAFREVSDWCSAKQGYASGVPNGQQDIGARGAYCIKQGPGIKWFDAPKDFSVGDSNWGEAERQIYSWCQQEGWHGGFPNGKAAPGKRGCYCFKTTV